MFARDSPELELNWPVNESFQQVIRSVGSAKNKKKLDLFDVTLSYTTAGAEGACS